jgi:hypothetical protein
MRLDAVLRAHGFLRVERPPHLWELDAEDGPFLRLLGELIVAGLVRGTPLEELVLNVSNVTVQEDGLGGLASGDYVALTIRGRGSWAPEVTWVPGAASDRLMTADLDAAARRAGVRLAYTRDLGAAQGSVTVFFPRRPGA